MPLELNQLLTAAVQELQDLHTHIAALQEQVRQLQSQQQTTQVEVQSLKAALSALTSPPVTNPVISTPAVPAVLPTPVRTEAPPLSTVESLRAPLPAAPPTADGYHGEPRRPFVRWLPTTDDELPMIVARCRLKAEACRWSEQRRGILDRSGDFRIDVEPKDRDLIAQAKQLPDCFLWMSHSTGPNPIDSAEWLRIAGCFDALADAVSLVQKLLAEGDEEADGFEHGIDLLAESQSALRVAVTQIDGPQIDHDQARVFGWLKQVAMQRQIFIRRYMRLDDPADPNRWPQLCERIAEYDTRWSDSRRKVTIRKKMLGRLRFKLTHVAQLPATDRPHAWQSIADDIEELVQAGVPPSNVELRELLVPHVDDLPELFSTPKGFQLAVREVDRYLALQPEAVDDGPVEAFDPQLTEVAQLLAGKTIVLIGGDRRPHAAEALQQTFQLHEVIWIDTRAHESTSGFEPYVARPEVAMVLLAIRWSSHSYGEVQDFCRRYDKPFVRLPGGYNPRQVAAQILEQCSQRLTAG